MSPYAQHLHSLTWHQAARSLCRQYLHPVLSGSVRHLPLVWKGLRSQLLPIARRRTPGACTLFSAYPGTILPRPLLQAGFSLRLSKTYHRGLNSGIRPPDDTLRPYIVSCNSSLPDSAGPSAFTQCFPGSVIVFGNVACRVDIQDIRLHPVVYKNTEPCLDLGPFC